MHIRKLVCLALLLAPLPLCSSGCDGGADGTIPDEIFLLGVSSLDWQRIETLIDRGELPHFQRMIAEGVRAAPRGEDPLSTSSLWASLETGKSARKHGVVGAVERLDGGLSVPSRSISRHAMSVWQMLSANSRSVACVGLPGSWPAETVQGHVVSNTAMPNRWTETLEVNFEFERGRADTYPTVLHEEIASFMRDPQDLTREELARFFVLNERDLHRAFEEPLGSIFRVDNPLRDVALTYQTDRSYLDMALYLRREYRPDLTAVFLELPVVVSTAYWFFVEPEVYKSAQAEAHRFRNTVDEAYRWVDECLGRVMEELGPRSTLILVSERGFGTSFTPGTGAQPRPFPEAQPEGVLILRGPGLRRGIELARANLADLTPTILTLLGLPIGDDLDGHALTRAFTESFLRENPPSYRGSYELNWKPENRLYLPPDAAAP